ncbi:MAG: cupin domain-containing protein [Methylococcales bacterium]|nr:cupin domain-containing protein [Methylococcales bacterium]
MQTQILKNHEADEYYFDEGCFIWELSNSPNDPELSIARARVLPGMRTKLHRLSGVTERYVIISGTGYVEIGGAAPQVVGPGDVVIIPPSSTQTITNTGTEDLVFFALCTPSFTLSAYEDLSAG